MVETSGSASRKRILANLLRALVLLFVIAITIYIYSIREHVAKFSAYGYPGIFVVSLLANATILLPAPGVAIVFAMGGVFNPLGVALAASMGGALGELSGYLAGFSGQAIIERADIYEKMTTWVRKYGGFAVMLLAAIPNPFFDLAGIAAGALKMRIHRFIFFCWLGQLIKMLGFAYAGYFSLTRVFGH